MNYKELCNEDKIAAIMECNFWRCYDERSVVEQYIKALKRDNHTGVKKVGSSLQKTAGRKTFTIFSTCCAARAKNLNHSVTTHGRWPETRLTSPALLPPSASPVSPSMNMAGPSARRFLIETFAFGGAIKGNMRSNSVTTDREPNGKWAYGLDLSPSQSGSYSGLSVFSDLPHQRH